MFLLILDDNNAHLWMCASKLLNPADFLHKLIHFPINRFNCDRDRASLEY